MSEVFLGEVTLLPYDFAPRDWEKCEGQTLTIVSNPSLFSLVRTLYGGDGRTTFALPDLHGKSPDPSVVYCICVNGIFPQRPS